jgi:hypothetical protein
MEGQTLVYLLCAKIAAAAWFVEAEMGALRGDVASSLLYAVLSFVLSFGIERSYFTVVTIIFALRRVNTGRKQ